MKIALFMRNRIPHSVGNYIDNSCRELALLGVDIVRFHENDVLPDNVDLYWDPMTGRPSPYIRLKGSKKPVVVTYHGAANVALPLHECFGHNPKRMASGYLSRRRTVKGWRTFEGSEFSVIAVSIFAKKEFINLFGLIDASITPIYHGVNNVIFKPLAGNESSDYLLHVSSYQPKKNLPRIIRAYKNLDVPNKPKLIAIVPGYKGKTNPCPCAEIILSPMNHKQIAGYYRNALAFVFPSLHETFGMPIFEAMASGCPVITSNTTACMEVAADAALLVDPYSVSEISTAMKKLILDTKLRETLVKKGNKRASQFTWKRCAAEHLSFFEKVLSNAK